MTENFKVVESSMIVISSSFTRDVHSALSWIQIELTVLTCTDGRALEFFNTAEILFISHITWGGEKSEVLEMKHFIKLLHQYRKHYF